MNAYTRKAWFCEYNHDRRKHRHKCRCCGKIVNAGERVMMCVVKPVSAYSSYKTYVVHEECAKLPVMHGRGWTWEMSMYVWAGMADNGPGESFRWLVEGVELVSTPEGYNSINPS